MRELTEEETKIIQEFKRKIEAIAKDLGMIVDYGNEDNMRWSRWATLKNGDIGIHIRDSWNKQGMFHISGNFPRDLKGQVCGPSKHDIEINVSNKKTPDQIIRDINNRFMPTYKEQLQRAIEQRDKANQYYTNKAAAIKKIFDYFREPITDRNDNTVYVYNKIPGCHLGAIQAYGENSIRFEIETKPESAIAIFDFLKTRNGKVE